MDRIKFNNIARIVSKSFGTTKSKLFEKSKEPHIVQPRHVLWLACMENGISQPSIRGFTEENGLKVHRTTVLRGIESAERLAKYDKRVETLIKSITQ